MTIEEAKAAIAKTKSLYLKRDYEKYLRKLRKRLSATNGQRIEREHDSQIN